jgi:uncharacterized protein
METACPPGSTRPQCTEHPQAPATARCVRCNKLLCSVCRVVYGNRNYCHSCYEKVGAGQGAPAQPYRDYVPPAHPGAYPPQQGANNAGPAQPFNPPPPGYYGPAHQPPPPGYYPYQYPPVPYRPAREVVFPGAPWGLGEAVLIFAISVVLASAASFLIAQVLRTSFTSTTSSFLLIFLSSVVLYTFLLAGTFYSVKVRHHSTLAALGLKLDGFGHGVALGFVLGMPLFLGAIFIAFIIQKLVNPTTTDQVSRSVNNIASGSVGWGLVALLFITLVILAPVCEEIFFRGYLYPALRNRMNKQPAMIINGALFAAAHFELVGFLPRFLLGWGLCYIYERNRTLGGPMTGHALYNGLVLLLLGVFHVF